MWGRIRRSTEAARANLLAQEYIRRGVMLSLVSDVAAGYFNLLELERELAIARESSRTYKQTLDFSRSVFSSARIVSFLSLVLRPLTIPALRMSRV